VDLKKAQSLFLAYWDVLSKKGENDQTSLIEPEIKTTPGHPIKNRIRPLNPTLEANFYKQIDKWQSEGVIEPSLSPWNFGLVAAPKKSSTIRWCVDFSGLNQRSTVDSHPLQNIEDNLSRLSRSCVYSTLDGAGARHVVPIKKQDREKTAFGTPWGSYQFRRMPFGLCNAPATYCRIVHMVLQGIPYSMALPYLDDTCVHSRNLAEHFTALQTVLEAFRKAALKLQLKKCFLFKSKVEYLGHMVSKEGIRTVPWYTQVIKDCPMPETREQVCTFLGKCGYYRRFVDHYSQHTKPSWTSLEKSKRGTQKSVRLHLWY
jgi:hypothetical protein